MRDIVSERERDFLSLRKLNNNIFSLNFTKKLMKKFVIFNLLFSGFGTDVEILIHIKLFFIVLESQP